MEKLYTYHRPQDMKISVILTHPTAGSFNYVIVSRAVKNDLRDIGDRLGAGKGSHL